ncbi:hypothetical protein B7463_g8875, partial [Scytalidium lignicola]
MDKPSTERVENIVAIKSGDEGLAQVDWTADEERAVKRKIDFIILPLLGLSFFALQMDRGNIANALTDTITHDLGITTNQINIGTQLLSCGIIIIEIPSNILLQKVGPQRWLLLGLCEAGFIPGALYTMSNWYKKSETSFRVSVFFVGNLLAAATISLIGAGILSMSGRYGIAGWKWLFMIEGIITVCIGVVFMLYFPASVTDGSPLVSRGRWSYFTDRELHICTSRVLLDDPAKAKGKIEISRHDIVDTMKKPYIWCHVLIAILVNSPTSALQTYGPSIVKSLGFTAVHANALYSVGFFISIILVLILGLAADYTERRGPFALIGALWGIISYVCLRQTPPTMNKWNRYAAVIAANGTNSVVHVINIGWLSLNCTSPQQRSLAMAMVIMAANCGGVIGGQFFRADDAPLYHRAFTIMLAFASTGLVLVAGQMLWYMFSNRRLASNRSSAAEPRAGVSIW